jgi:uncharacterized protein (DUF1501 family)
VSETHISRKHLLKACGVLAGAAALPGVFAANAAGGIKANLATSRS